MNPRAKKGPAGRIQSGLKVGEPTSIEQAHLRSASVVATAPFSGLSRACRFICNCIRLRSISSALWLDAYDQAEVTHV